jgi:hypothetical protein
VASRGWTAPDDLGHLGERVAEHVVQQERAALRGGERLEHHEQRHAHGLVEVDLAGRIGLVGIGLDERLGQPRTHVAFAARARRRQRVDGEATHDGGEPRTQVANLRSV